jgi:hypothetical protein
MSKASRRSTINDLISTAIGVVVCVTNVVWYVRSSRPEGPILSKIWLALLVCSVIIGLFSYRLLSAQARLFRRGDGSPAFIGEGIFQS